MRVSSSDIVRSWETIDQAHYVDPVQFLKVNPPTYEVFKEDFRMLNNFKVAGYSCNELKSLDDIFDLMIPEDRDFVLGVTVGVVNHMLGYYQNVMEASLTTIFRLKGKNGKVSTYKRYGIVNGVRDGKIASNFTYMEDITWMNVQDTHRYQLAGNGSNYFDHKFPEIEKFKDLLTPREIEVLGYLVRGFSSRDVAIALKISKLTVDTHRKNMRTKLDVANTPELVNLAQDMNLSTKD